MFKGDCYGSSSPGGGKLRLRQILDFIVSAFDIEIWAGSPDGFERHFVWKNDDEIYGRERCDDCRSICFCIDRSVISFAEELYGCVAVDGDDKAGA